MLLYRNVIIEHLDLDACVLTGAFVGYLILCIQFSQMDGVNMSLQNKKQNEFKFCAYVFIAGKIILQLCSTSMVHRMCFGEKDWV